VTIFPFITFHHKLSGWKRALFAFVWGGLSILAFAPFNFFPVLAISLTAFFLLLQKTKTPRAAFLIGWSFGFGFFVFSFYWIAGALFVDIKSFWWVLPLAVGGLPCLFALYYGIVCALAHRFLNLNRLEGLVGFGLALFLAEYARGYLFTGFPWNLFGYIWADWLPWLQSTSIAGIYGLTFITIFLALTPTLFALPSLPFKKARQIAFASFALFCIMGLWGSWRLAANQTTFVPDVKLRLVQPAIDQKIKWVADKKEENFQNLLVLSFGDGADGITHIIWPETATAFYLNEDIEHRLAIVNLLPEKATLITGSVQRETTKTGERHYYNSLITTDRSGYITSGYDKSHLVPFGEYIPFKDYLPESMASAVGVNFSAGSGLLTIKLPGLPAFSPLVCYEAIFPGAVARRDDRPQMLINVTNDAWYRGTIGPDQHFAIVRTRAVEEGVPIVRVSNMGISAVTDPLGRTIASTGMDSPESVDSLLPNALNNSTVFALYDQLFLWILFIFTLFFVILAQRKAPID
jgi:apolipoprotein N-acyltransferase